MITGIYLAAGQSRRFGTHKLLLEVDGRPLFTYGLGNCVDSRLTEVLVVLGARSEEMGEAIGRLFDHTEKIRTVVNEDHERGMMSSLKRGISSIDPGSRGAMVFLADMPIVTPKIIDQLMEVFEEENRIIIPECEGRQYHPRILPAWTFPDFLELEDDEKGTKVLERYPEEIIHVRVGNRHNYIDIDRPEDVDALLSPASLQGLPFQRSDLPDLIESPPPCPEPPRSGRTG